MSLQQQRTPEKRVLIEGIPLTPFQSTQELFNRILAEIEHPGCSVIHYLNVHVVNQAHQQYWLKKILKKADLVYCDGAGIGLASMLLGASLLTRFPAADWFIDLIAQLSSNNHTVYLLGGAPGISEATCNILDEKQPGHLVVGNHHGYIIDDETLEQQVIDEINKLKPDLLVVGFGTPLQEYWIDSNRHRLQVSTIIGLGAVMDFVSGKASRCPKWMGDAGFEWLYRLLREPARLFERYVVGNPWFLSRIVIQMLQKKLAFKLPQKPLPSQ